MPCRTELFHCNECGGEHYYMNECLRDPTKRGEGTRGYNPETAALNTSGALCDVLNLLKDKNLLETVDIPQDILDWWKKHQEAESKRRK